MKAEPLSALPFFLKISLDHWQAVGPCYARKVVPFCAHHSWCPSLLQQMTTQRSDPMTAKPYDPNSPLRPVQFSPFTVYRSPFTVYPSPFTKLLA